MSVPGVGSEAAEQISSDGVTDKQAQISAEKEADELENARDAKSDADDANDENASNNEADKLESGAFQPHAYPHLNWQDTSPPKEDGQTSKCSDSVTNGTTPPPSRKQSIANAKPQNVMHSYDRGGARRRSSVQGPQIATEAARAEAASWAQMTPLLAATLGPLSILLGIPTLTQRWHGVLLDPPLLPNGVSNFVELPDPTLNVILAGVSLFCEVMGNALLVLRFSNFHTQITTWVSYAFWMAKIIIGIFNYVEFGIKYRETGNIIYLQGFWVHSTKLSF